MDRRMLVKALALSPAISSSVLHAQETWPRRPIRIIVPSGPGGTSDILLRALAEPLGAELGQSIIVDNRPGAGGTVAAAAAARADPDGSTFMMNSLATHGIAPAMYKLSFDPDRDVSAVALLVQMPNVLYVRSDFPAGSVQQLLEFGRRNPGKLSYSSSGQGTTTHLSGARLAAASAMDMLHVPYNGAGPAVQAVLRGEVSFAFENIGAVVGQIRGGALKALAVTAGARSVQLPDVVTMTEAGMPGFEIATWFGIVGPAGVPRAIVERFSQAWEKVMRQPESAERAMRLGAETRFLGSSAFEAFMRSEREQWRRAVQAAGLKVE